MRRVAVTLFLMAFVACSARADEEADKLKALLAQQKKQAEANWELLAAGDFAHVETDHFILYAPKSLEKKLKDAGTLLENQYKTALEALKFPEKTEPWKGKVAVYLFAERPQYGAFVRRVEQRRFESGDVSSRLASDDKLLVACSPPVNKWDWPVEAQAAAEVASLMQQRRAGLTTILPDWLDAGFGRATYYRTMPKDASTLADRRQAAAVAAQKKLTAQNVWNGPLDADESASLGGALADFFAYGPGAARFGELLDAFKPEENVEKKTIDQAIEKTRINKEKIEPEWKKWVANPK
jgi:hypothetical protein